MPCSSGYMDPNSDETVSHELCLHLDFVLTQLEREIPYWIKTGCNSIYGRPDRREQACQLLCELITGMNPTLREQIVYNPHSKYSRNLANWWEEHQEADKLRIKKEEENKPENLIAIELYRAYENGASSEFSNPENKPDGWGFFTPKAREIIEQINTCKNCGQTSI